MPVHDMTTRDPLVGAQVPYGPGDGVFCGVCGYGEISGVLVHSARCVGRPPDAAYVACRWRECRRVLDPVRVAANAATSCDDRHRAAAWKEESQYGRRYYGPGATRANGSQARRKPSGAQVAWGKALGTLSSYFQSEAWDAEDAEAKALEILRPALSERQRAQLEARERSNT